MQNNHSPSQWAEPGLCLNRRRTRSSVTSSGRRTGWHQVCRIWKICQNREFKLALPQLWLQFQEVFGSFSTVPTSTNRTFDAWKLRDAWLADFFSFRSSRCWRTSSRVRQSPLSGPTWWTAGWTSSTSDGRHNSTKPKWKNRSEQDLNLGLSLAIS